MAIVCATGSDYLQRTTGLLNPASNSTVMLWVKTGAISVGPNYQTGYVLLDDPAVYTQYAGLFYYTDGTDHCHLLDINNSNVNTTTPSVSVWTHYAWVQSGTTQRLYTNGALIGSFTKNRAADVLGFEYLGNDTFSDGDLTIGLCRQWSVALTGSQIQAEMSSGTVVHTANLWANWPLIADVNDISGNGRDWTTIGSVTFDDGPQPANYSPATATAITVLPFTDTVTMDPPMDAWYVYTADATNTVGMWGFGDLVNYKPFVDVFSPDSVTVYPVANPISGNAQNVPIQFPVVSGIDYYFKFYSNSVTSGTLAVSMLAGPTQDLVEGAILVNDDSLGFSAAVLSGVNGDNQNVLYYIPGIAVGEGGDVVSVTGNILLEHFPTDEMWLYDKDLSNILTTLSFGGTGAQKLCIRANQNTQIFYAAERLGVGDPQVRRVTADGVMTSLPTPTPSSGLGALSVNDDESILYMVFNQSTNTSAIKQWSLTGSVFAADLVADIAGYAIRDMLLLTDGTLLALYTKEISPGDIFVKRYDNTGALLNTYQLATNVQIPTVTPGYRLTSAIDDPVSFWVWYHQSDGEANAAGISNFVNLNTTDGSSIATVIYTDYQEGVYVPSPTADPFARFGMSSSCPFIILRGIAPTPPNVLVREYLIRRERWFPVLTKEQHRITAHLLQLYFEAGTGIATGQGSDPICELDWSDDGGHTWSHLHLIKTGKMGERKRRAIKRMMGQFRERVYRVAVTDPVQWSLIDAFFQATEGTS